MFLCLGVSMTESMAGKRREKKRQKQGKEEGCNQLEKGRMKRENRKKRKLMSVI